MEVVDGFNGSVEFDGIECVNFDFAVDGLEVGEFPVALDGYGADGAGGEGDDEFVLLYGAVADGDEGVTFAAYDADE